MKRCGAKPYEGMEPYVFISYCHKDKMHVFPMIEQLAHDGYRVWYDEGIDPGSEWPEVIADHLNRCSLCLACISENSLNSHNCRREINFALLKKKAFLSVILEQVKMSPGMEMQLSSNQSVFKYSIPSEREFFDKLTGMKEMADCKGQPNLNIVVSCPEEHLRDENGMFAEAGERDSSFSDKWFVDAESVAMQRSSAKKSVAAVDGSEMSAESTEQIIEAEKADKKETFVKKCYLLRKNTNIQIEIPEGVSGIGRSGKMSSIKISGNEKIGRLHVYVKKESDHCVVSDNHSTNGTYLNGTRLESEKEYVLADGDVLRLADEEFIFHIE